jgi:putative nucleotidyltransferase with HDIG domain
MTAGTATPAVTGDAHWRARPFWAAGVRLAVVAVPVAAGIAVAAIMSRTLEHPRPGTAPWWAFVLVGATAASALIAAGARRLLPLAALLELALVFPDHTPSRFRVALRAGSVNRLQRQVHHVRQHGAGVDASDAAETILELATALNVHDARTRGHSERVRALAELIAVEMRLSTEDRDRLRWAALLHDCGKLLVHTDVLNKKGELSAEEWEQVRNHPLDGARLAAPLALWLGPWSLAIAEHHERWDGTGYPFGRSRHEISLGARIVAVADSFEVMTSARSYQRAVTPDVARSELARQAGHQFDPAVVRAFLALSIGRLRWLVGPMSWLAELPVIRAAAHTPTAAAPAALTGLTLAAASVLGLVTAPDTLGPAPAPAQVAAAVPDLPRSSPGPEPAPQPAAAPPTDVLAEQVEAPAAPTAPVVVAEVPVEPAPAPVVVAAPDAGVVTPAAVGPTDACVEVGPVSGLVDGAVEPVAGAIAAPLATVVDTVDCGAVVPVEDLLSGLLG